jgi:hypothetical protein
MTNKIIYTAIAFFSGLISFEVIAQSHLDLQYKPNQIFPKKLYIEKYLGSNSLLPNKIEKVGTSELFDYYKLPLDNMICISPTKGVNFKINVFDPTIAKGYFNDNIPNAFSKGELLK